MQLDGKFAEITYSNYCPIVKCTTEDELFSRLSKKARRNFRHDMRVIQKEQDGVHSVAHGEGVVVALEEFFKLRDQKSKFPGKDLRRFLNAFVAKYNGESPVQIDMLSVSGQTVAGLLHLKYRESYLPHTSLRWTKNLIKKSALGTF